MTGDAPDDLALRSAPDAPPAAPPAPPAAVQRPRWWRMVLVVVLSGLAMVLGWYAATRFDATGGVDPRTAFDVFDAGGGGISGGGGEMLYSSSATSSNPLHPLLTRPADADPLRFNAAHHPLDHEPADLPPPALSMAAEHPPRNIGRYQLIDGVTVDEISYWRVPGPATTRAWQGVEQHYRQAALESGFIRISANGPPDAADDPRKEAAQHRKPRSRTTIFIDPDDTSRVLSVRVAPRESDLHVTVWLRYTVLGN